MNQVTRSKWLRVLLGAAGVAALAVTATGAHAGISNTKHNLGGGSGPGSRNQVAATDTAEICVFCHTPHGASTTTVAPLWNKNLGAGTGYTLYNSSISTTLDGETMTTVGSVSLACLSCHDGTQAMDNILNAPGSGGFSTGGGATGLGYTWTSAAAGRIDAQGRLTNTATTGYMLATDLSNDHPIGIRYCGGGQSSGTPNGACTDADFISPVNTTINTVRVWWVDTTGGTANTREKTDMILYNRSFPTLGQTGPSVECASCHDPHVEAKATNQVAFLRVSQAGSGVCLACHNK